MTLLWTLIVCLISGATQVDAQIIRVSNPIPELRVSEVVEARGSTLSSMLAGRSGLEVTVVEAETRVPVRSQWLPEEAGGPALLWEVTLDAMASADFLLDPNTPPPFQPAVQIVHEPHRDDILWENRYLAVRTFGQGLRDIEPLVSSGYDVWTKRTADLIAQRWYALGSAHYHTDHGEGADFFSVGPSLGAGATGAWTDGGLVRSSNFEGHLIHASGPLRAVVDLSYAPIALQEASVTESRRITLDAGARSFQQETQLHAPIVTGLVRRDGIETACMEHAGWTARLSFGPLANGGHGTLGLAVFSPSAPSVACEEEDAHTLLTLGYGQSMHYVTMGWSAAGGPATFARWRQDVQNEIQRLLYPLEVAVHPD